MKDSASQEKVVQDAESVPNLVDPPKRRRKKTEVLVVVHTNATPSTSTETTAELIDAKDSVASPKPKRTRRVGESKPKRYAVGEPKTEHNP